MSRTPQGPEHDESAQTAPRAHESTSAGLLSDVAGTQGTMTVNAFLDALSLRLEEMVRVELANTPYAGRPCPWIPYLTGRYRNRPAVEVSRALRLYLRGRQPQTPSAAIQELVDIGRRQVHEWLANGGPPPPAPSEPMSLLSNGSGDPSDAADVWRLGTGVPMPGDARARMEGALGTDLSRVRIHDHDEAHGMARSANAHAFAVGHEIGFARNRFQPGTIVGDAILAHELAHASQFQRGDRRTGATAEHDADVRAAHAVGRLYAPSSRSLGDLVGHSARGSNEGSSRGTGLGFRRCGGAPDVPHVDWRQQDRVLRDDIARQIREKHEEITRIMVHAQLSDEDFSRMNTLYNDIDALVLRLRLLGYQAADSDLLTGILSGGPEDRRIHILALRGATPAPVYWGERRRFEIDIDWLPPETEMFVEWFIEGNDGEWAMRNEGLPPRLTMQEPTGSIELGPDIWYGPVGDQILMRQTSRFRVIARLRVGGGGSPPPPSPAGTAAATAVPAGYEAAAQTDWIPATTNVPTNLTIISNGIMYPPSSSPMLPGVAGAQTGAPLPTQPATQPATAPGTAVTAAAAPSSEGVALERAALEFRPSWIAPSLPSRPGAFQGYVSEWNVTDPDGTSQTVFFDPYQRHGQSGDTLNLNPRSTGRYTLRLRIRPAQLQGFGTTTTSAPVAEAALAFRVLSSDELAQRGLDAVQRMGVSDYATTMRDLDAQIASVDRVRGHGSPAMSLLDQQRVALGQQSRLMLDNLGDAPTPLPAQGPLDPSRTYVAPLPAAMAVPEARSAIPLRTFLRIDAFETSIWSSGIDVVRYAQGMRWRARIVEATTQDVIRFEGYGRTPADAARAAVADWQSRNEYPQNGTVRWDVNVLGERIQGSYTTSAFRKTFWEWFDRIVFGLQAIIAVLLLVTPEPTGLTKVAGLALLTVTVLRGVYRLYESLSLGRPILDERHVLEALGIILAFVGLRGGSMMARAGATGLAREALSAQALATFQVGRGLVLTAAGGMAGSFTWVAYRGMQQMRQIAADTNLPEAERERRIQGIMQDLASNGLLLIGMNATLFRPGALTPQGTRAPAFVDAMGDLQLDPVMRSRMEGALRRFGATEDLSTLEPRALIERYMQLQQARASVGEQVEVTGATRGHGVYEVAAEGTQTAATVDRASRPLTRAFGGENFRIQNIAAGATGLTAELVVEVPASGSSPQQTLTVRVQIEIVPQLDPATGSHGAESGMARVSVAGDQASGFRLRIELDSRIANEADVRINLGHELREGAGLIRRITQDPTTDVAAQQRGGVFEPGTSTVVTDHAHATAFEFRDLITELQRALANYETARAAAGSARGRPIPDAVRQAGEAAYRRIDALLDSMGFADPVTRAQKRAALLAELNAPEGSPIANYVDGYANRQTARVARQGALAPIDPVQRTGLVTGLGPELEAYLMRSVPGEAIAPLAEAMSRNDPANNGIRNALREALRQHRAGRLTDAALIDVAQRLNTLTRNYSGVLGEPANSNELTRALQTESSSSIANALNRFEARVAARGTTGPAGTATAGTRFVPENELVGNGRHGVTWTQNQAQQAVVSDVAELVRDGRPVPPQMDLGQFGSLADVWYAVQCARQQLAPQGSGAVGPTGAPLPFQGVFQLPAAGGNRVLRFNISPSTNAVTFGTTVAPDVVYVNVRPDGSVHAYPAHSTMINLGAFGGAAGIRPVVVY